MTSRKNSGLICIILPGVPLRHAVKAALARLSAALIPRVIAMFGLGALGNAVTVPLVSR